ncbi:MAG: hypothetical protein QME92_04155 [Bacillota bacterium]|nr:hypothetical protein [Bacillota bacterium]
MGVYLDIDADFMFRPRTNGNSGVRQELWMAPGEIVGWLQHAGVGWDARPAAVFTDHKEAYFVWKEWGARSATLVHVDAHSDFYDTFTWLVHCGNFVRKAVEDGLFSKIVWVVPRWLYDSGEWEPWDTPGVRLHRHRKTPSYHEQGRCRAGREVEVEIVPHDRFFMPNSRAALVTVATSPAFVPPEGLPQVKDLVDRVAERCLGLAVRPHIPMSIEDGALRRLWLDVRRGDGATTRRAAVSGAAAAHRLLSYLWVEHDVAQRRHQETRAPGPPAPTARAGFGRAS